jgi:type I restriction enzyme S subunit
MSEWKEYKLSEIMEIIGGGTPKTSMHEYWNGAIPWLSVVDFSNNRKLVFDTEKKITEKGLQESSTKVLKKGQIIISARGTVGALAVLGKDMAFNQSCYGLNAKEDLTFNDYLYYLVKDNVSSLLNNTHGAVFDTITRETFDHISVELPPLPEQQSIASILSSMDDKIDLLHRQNKTLEALAETLFRQWFVEGAEEGWETVRVGDLVHTNVASISKDNTPKTISYLDTGSLTEGKIDGYQTLDIADAPSRARRIVKHNDVLISTVRPDQKHYGILKNPAEDVIASTGFCVITCDKINPHFIYILLTTDEMTEYLHSIAEGSTSTYPPLRPSDIEGLEFQLPPQEKLDAFSEYAYNTWSKIEHNHTQICTLEKLRDTLLPKLMGGEVRVKYDKEPVA